MTPPDPHTLWFRPTRRHKWRAAGTAADHAGAVALIGTGGEPDGDWIVLPAGEEPGRVKSNPKRGADGGEETPELP